MSLVMSRMFYNAFHTGFFSKGLLKGFLNRLALSSLFLVCPWFQQFYDRAL